jgi:hypothetical protein
LELSESQRIVLDWKGRLREQGWTEDAIKRVVSDLCEAGYRQCVDDLQARSAQTDALIEKVAVGGRTL